MKRFRFPLDQLLRLRRHAERAAQRELAARLAVVNGLEGELANIVSNLAVCEVETGAARMLGNAMSQGLRLSEQRVERRLESARAEAEQARAVYAERRRDMKALDDLRERRQEEWRAETMRAEQAELDEIARLRHAARVREHSEVMA